MNFLAILECFDDKIVQRMRTQFMNGFRAKVAEEQKYCREHKVEPRMTTQKADEVRGILRKCGTAFHVEAIKRLVLTELMIPSFEMVDEKAALLRGDALKSGTVSIEAPPALPESELVSA